MKQQPDQQSETAGEQPDYSPLGNLYAQAMAPKFPPPSTAPGFVPLEEAAKLIARAMYPDDDYASIARRQTLYVLYLKDLLNTAKAGGVKAHCNFTNRPTSQPNENSVIAINDLYSFAIKQYGLVLQGQIDDQEPHPATNSRETAEQQPAPAALAMSEDDRATMENLKSFLLGQTVVAAAECALTTQAPQLVDELRHARPLPAQRFQEQEILRVIGELGYDAKKLPKDINGKDGVKAEVRKGLAIHRWTPTVFDKAWERLSKTKEIFKLK